MRNSVQPGMVLTIPAPATVASGDVVISGKIVGIAKGDAASGADVAVCTEGVFELAKDTSLAITVGDRVYWDAVNDEVDKTNTNQALGVAVETVGASATTVKVKLLPGFAAAA